MADKKAAAVKAVLSVVPCYSLADSKLALPDVTSKRGSTDLAKAQSPLVGAVNSVV